MLRLAFITHGSTGDTVPIIRLAQAAVQSGHEATLLAGSFWREAAESRGIRFLAIPPYGDKSEQVDYMQRFAPIRNKRVLLEKMFAKGDEWQSEILPKLEEILPKTDSLVCSSLFPLYTPLAQKHGLPTISVHFCPNTYHSPFHPPDDLLPLPQWFPRGVQRSWNEGFTTVADRYLVGKLNRNISRPEQRLASWLRSPTDFHLVLAPSLLHRGQPGDLPANTAFTGFLQGGFSAEDSDEQSNTQAGCPILTFGSVTTDKLKEEFRSLYRSWPKERGLLVQEGWFTPPKPPEDSLIRIVPPAPHGPLFSAASSIIHHGGAGTTTSAFYAGKPQIVIPHFADQDYWAKTVKRQGCGMSLTRRGWGKSLGKAVETIESKADYAERATDFAKLIAREDSAVAAIRKIESWVEGS